MMFWTRAVITLVLSIMMLSSVKTEYELQISVHSFNLLRAQCAVCIRPFFVVATNQSCDGGSTCDVFFIFCQREQGTPSNSLECPPGGQTIQSEAAVTRQNSSVQPDSEFFGLPNPIILSSSNWAGGTQFFAVVIDNDVFDPNDLIDTLVIDLDNPIGTSISRTTYTGRFANTQADLSFRVVCAENYYGPDCSQFCEDSPCACDPGFTGEFCQIDINECEGVNCSGNGLCVNGINSFVCQCEPSFTGELCDTTINYCEGVNCSGHGQCVNGINSFTCQCDPGFSGEFCEINFDDCEGVNCSGNGQCVDGINSFNCQCNLGYTGELCETNIDDCMANNCSGNGQCMDGLNNHTCECLVGFTGATCSVNIDDCFGVNCSGNGQCLDGVGNYTCVCNPGYNGTDCETQIDHCVGISCSGNGRCINDQDSPSCDCFLGYTGASCDTQMTTESKDSCYGIDCSGNGECIITESMGKGYVCLCNQLHFGENCESTVSVAESQVDAQSNRLYIMGGIMGGVIFLLLAVIFVLLFLLALQNSKKKGISQPNSMKYNRLRNLQLSLPLPTNHEMIPGDNPVYGAPTNYTPPVTSDYHEVGPTESEVGISYSCDVTVASTSTNSSSGTAAIQGHTYEEI